MDNEIFVPLAVTAFGFFWFIIRPLLYTALMHQWRNLSDSTRKAVGLLFPTIAVLANTVFNEIDEIVTRETERTATPRDDAEWNELRADIRALLDTFNAWASGENETTLSVEVLPPLDDDPNG